MVCRLPNIWFIHGQKIPYGIKLFIKVRIGRMDFTDQHKNSLHQLLTIWLIIHVSATYSISVMALLLLSNGPLLVYMFNLVISSLKDL